METLTVSTEESLYRFLEEYGRNREERELLAFWGMHPNARFTRYAICYGLDCNKQEANRALMALVEQGIIDTSSSNGLIFYSLTKNEEKRRPVVELAALGWDQWLAMLRRIENRERSTKCQSLPDKAIKVKIVSEKKPLEKPISVKFLADRRRALMISRGLTIGKP